MSASSNTPASTAAASAGNRLGVEDPSKQAGIVGAVDVAGLDVEGRRAADEVQHRHHGGQLVALGQPGTGERGEPGIQPRQLAGIRGRARRRGLQHPRVPVVDIPQADGPIGKGARPIRSHPCAGAGARVPSTA